MVKRVVLGTLAVFVAWSVLDMVFHSLILGPSYQATAHLWRPMEEMNMGGMYIVGFIAALLFTCFYTIAVNPKSFGNGVKFGMMFGLTTGFSMGFGTYIVMPITLIIAVVWFVGTVIESVVGGMLVGKIVKQDR